MRIEVETRNMDGQVTSLGSAEPFTLGVDRPIEGGGGGLGFDGGQLLYLAVAGCISRQRIAEVLISAMRAFQQVSGSASQQKRG